MYTVSCKALYTGHTEALDECANKIMDNQKNKQRVSIFFKRYSTFFMEFVF